MCNPLTCSRCAQEWADQFWDWANRDAWQWWCSKCPQEKASDWAEKLGQKMLRWRCWLGLGWIIRSWPRTAPRNKACLHPRRQCYPTMARQGWWLDLEKTPKIKWEPERIQHPVELESYLHRQILRGIGSYSDGPPPLPPLPVKFLAIARDQMASPTRLIRNDPNCVSMTLSSFTVQYVYIVIFETLIWIPPFSWHVSHVTPCSSEFVTKMISFMRFDQDLFPIDFYRLVPAMKANSPGFWSGWGSIRGPTLPRPRARCLMPPRPWHRCHRRCGFRRQGPESWRV